MSAVHLVLRTALKLRAMGYWVGSEDRGEKMAMPFLNKEIEELCLEADEVEELPRLFVVKRIRGCMRCLGVNRHPYDPGGLQPNPQLQGMTN